MLTNLDSQLYRVGETVIDYHDKVEKLMLIQSGKCDLNSLLDQRNSKIEVRIVRLLESSWYGDFQILLDLESSFRLVAAQSNLPEDEVGGQSNSKQAQFKDFVHILSFKGKKFLKLLKQYPQWKRFLILRAAHRRSYFMLVLSELKNEIELLSKEKDQEGDKESKQ